MRAYIPISSSTTYQYYFEVRHTSRGGSGIPFSSSISASVFPHSALVIEKVAGRNAQVCSFEHKTGRRNRFLKYKEKMLSKMLNFS